MTGYNTFFLEEGGRLDQGKQISRSEIAKKNWRPQQNDTIAGGQETLPAALAHIYRNRTLVKKALERFCTKWERKGLCCMSLVENRKFNHSVGTRT